MKILTLADQLNRELEVTIWRNTRLLHDRLHTAVTEIGKMDYPISMRASYGETQWGSGFYTEVTIVRTQEKVYGHIDIEDFSTFFAALQRTSTPQRLEYETLCDLMKDFAS